MTFSEKFYGLYWCNTKLEEDSYPFPDGVTLRLPQVTLFSVRNTK